MKVSSKVWLITLLLCVSAVGSRADAEILAPTTPNAGFAFTRDLTLGIRGNDVYALQQFLITNGFLKTPTPTNYFGFLTRDALRAWQAQSGIYPAAGFFGPVSRGKISVVARQALARTAPAQDMAKATAAAVATTTAASAPTVNSKNGSPVRLKIPKLNIDAGFQYAGLKPGGTMEIPSNIVDVGWFTGSVRPGEKGTAIITGHVAQIRGGVMTKPGVFSNLSELSAGDTLYVLNDKGGTTTFIVRESRSYDPAADATDVFTCKDGGAHLNLITCEGTWNPARQSYSQRLVIFADAVQ